MPKVSIITPCYNSSAFLEETIQCVLSQSFQDWEWIITDDQSTDHSIAIIKKYQDPRIILLESPQNLGAGGARNLSLAQAKGRYITFLDSDDFWERTFLEEMLNFMENNQYELAYSTYSRCDEKLQPLLGNYHADTIVTFGNLLKTCRLSLLSSMYDSKRVGKFYFPEGSKREDHVMWLNLLKEIPKGMPLGKCLSKYRMHGNSVSRDKKKVIMDQYLVYKEHMKFSTIKSMYYTANWAINGFLKYSKLFN
ncbi:glycosyltransferase family 2 protein [Elizabethkingia sp. JS20170427COW]|uniref:glycosyltransferase family 2 protein n=1 Tax=Elizabethkingia sp. JS20170427COW TaxID=2583851 RepID=UPI001110360D|nr:glycosyltransferase family 2 protein [Elizabethkingia sp. JS20170427COW]QCX54482.1 glycosyltransferase family 2 protein [Elizabethkingia sp. JS20170427COW]